MITDLINSYNEIEEEKRLQSTLARRVEFLSTVEALSPFVSPGTKMLDCGCGTGIYSIYFAEKGCSVAALDLVPKHIQRLRALVETRDLPLSTIVGNAIDLSHFEDNAFDVVLCMGPLYHLTSREDRDKCLSECIRVVKHGGILAFAYISPYSVFPCVIRGDLSRASHALVRKIVEDKSIRADDECCFWTDNAYISPEDMEAWLRDSGLDTVDHLATDGQSIAFQSVINTMDQKTFSIWMDYHRKVCRVPSMLGSSNHGLILARKKE